MLHYGRFSPDIGIEPERDRLKLRRNNKFKKSSSLTKIPSCDANFFISSGDFMNKRTFISYQSWKWILFHQILFHWNIYFGGMIPIINC